MGWEDFGKNIRLEVGLGDRVKLWTDQWCGDSPLHLTFPNVYGIASNKGASVASSLEQLGIEERRSWDVILLEDQMIWKWVGWMIFSVPWAQIYLPLKTETVYDGS